MGEFHEGPKDKEPDFLESWILTALAIPALVLVVLLAVI